MQQTCRKKDRDNKNKQFDLEFKANLQAFIKRTTTYEENLFKAYAFLWEKCTKGMQNKIASRKDFENRIYNDPINLLTSIKSICSITKKQGMRCPSSWTP